MHAFRANSRTLGIIHTTATPGKAGTRYGTVDIHDFTYSSPNTEYEVIHRLGAYIG